MNISWIEPQVLAASSIPVDAKYVHIPIPETFEQFCADAEALRMHLHYDSDRAARPFVRMSRQ